MSRFDTSQMKLGSAHIFEQQLLGLCSLLSVQRRSSDQGSYPYEEVSVETTTLHFRPILHIFLHWIPISSIHTQFKTASIFVVIFPAVALLYGQTSFALAITLSKSS